MKLISYLSICVTDKDELMHQFTIGVVLRYDLPENQQQFLHLVVESRHSKPIRSMHSLTKHRVKTAVIGE